MMRKYLAPALLTALLLLTLTACKHEHVWQPATCTEPEICADCGEVQGEALGHTWTPASYQTAETCSVCGEIQGEPLTADFEKEGFACTLEVGVPAAYTTSCYEAPSVKTTGQVTITDYKILNPETDAEEIAALEARIGTALEPLEGYEWRVVYSEALYSDANAYSYGMMTGSCHEDYYDIKLHDDTIIYGSDELKDGTLAGTYSANWNGEQFDQCLSIGNAYWGGWVNGTNTYYSCTAFRVPVGYDGTVVGFYDYSVAWEDGMYITDVQAAGGNALFFRLK